MSIQKFRLVALVGLACLVVLNCSIPASAQSEQEAPVDPSLFQAMEWRSVGPFRGGRSVTATGVPGVPLTYYFGSVGGGVWKTEDAGETWRNITDGSLGTSSVGAVAVAPSDPNVLYVGMGEHAVRGVTTSHGDGVYRSTDAGQTWQHIGLKESRAISRIRIHPNDPDVVYVAVQGAPYGPSSHRGIYQSVDGGANWRQVHSVDENTGASDLAMDPTNPRILYAAYWDHRRQPWEVRSGGPGSGLFKSVNGGETWEKLEKGLPQLMGKVGVAVSADPNRVYAIVEAEPEGGLYRSDDAGKSWRLMSSNPGIKARAWYYIEVVSDPSNPDVVWVLNAPLWKSIDGGKTFEQVRVPHGDTHDLWINPEDSRYVILADDGGATISTNGGRTWSTQNNQPTAQFYRVNTDNQFPYWIYGGQQDNSTVAIASRAPGGIGWKHWREVGGCESGFAAFDPENPRYVYAGCYMGLISEYDSRYARSRDVMAYPVMPAAVPPREMKYRFNWNAPILVSRHDPSVIYHAGNVVLKSTNRGNSWAEVSPDLTRNDREKQGPGGSPITVEGAGGEIYGTITYLIESPHDPLVLWAGSDDGLIHVTRDGGKTWDNVTPPDLPEAQVNAIEVSPHHPATAFLAVTRYKFDDFTPHVFRTTDFGRTWSRLVEGIPDDAWVRVVREDPVRQGLLFAGTELGPLVSFDDGGHWQSLQLNLPLTPVTDLQIRRNDLVAATQGRSFWVLDDLSPLRQLAVGDNDKSLHLFSPSPAYRVSESGVHNGGEPSSRLGKNPPEGAVIDFLIEQADQEVRLEILTGEGDLVRTYIGRKKEEKPEKEPSKPGQPSQFELKPGMNRLVWNLRYENVPSIPGVFAFGSLSGRRVVPGTYQVRLASGQETQEVRLEVMKDPTVEVGVDSLRLQEQLMSRLDAQLGELHRTIERAKDVEGQLELLKKRSENHARQADLEALVDGFSERLAVLVDRLYNKRVVDGQTVINFPARLNHDFVMLRSALDGAEGEVTEGQTSLLEELSGRWASARGEAEQLLGEDLAALNTQAQEWGIPAVAAKPPSPE